MAVQLAADLWGLDNSLKDLSELLKNLYIVLRANKNSDDTMLIVIVKE